MPTSTRLPDQFDANVVDIGSLVSAYNTHPAARQFKDGLIAFVRAFGFDAAIAVTAAFTTAVTAAAAIPTVLDEGSKLSVAIPVYDTTISVIPAQFSGIPKGVLTYQWKRGASNISGATASTYTPVSADIGQTLSCVVTSTNGTGAVSSTATAGGVCVDDANAPHNSVIPSFTGTLTTTHTLTGVIGTWTPSPGLTYTQQWYRDSTLIAGATALTYVIQTADISHVLTLQVTGRNAKGQTLAVSSAPSSSIAS